MKGYIIATYVDQTKHKVPLQVVLDDLIRDEIKEHQLDFDTAKENVMIKLEKGETTLLRHSCKMHWADLADHVTLISDTPSRLKQKFAWINAYKEVVHEQ